MIEVEDTNLSQRFRTILHLVHLAIMRSSILSVVLILATTMAEKLLYRNTFKDQDSIKNWVAEGPLKATVSNNSTY